ncbi:hypothetical protein ACPOL_2182 [Acidisarcina polymorpha]|uniref:Uncharacterized protein n=1 Tax=Acidisarcina polymorpha TaxID=2211140 RepID=A0A2Z5FYQ9_9BACT|nr:hypothetical protein ACPOL_2182 [Acidisarcina polymorpha]
MAKRKGSRHSGVRSQMSARVRCAIRLSVEKSPLSAMVCTTSILPSP